MLGKADMIPWRPCATWVSLTLLLLGSSSIAPAQNGTAATNASAAWKNAGADEELRQAFERVTYSLQDSGQGIWRGANPAQRLTLEFNGEQVWLSHPDGSVSLHLTGYGYGERVRLPARARLSGTGNRVEYQRGDLTEWYVNGSQGLEQGFTLTERPAGDRESKLLAIAFRVTGELVPVQKADAVLFESKDGAVLRYAGLKAVDARGRVLPSRLDVRGREIRLLVEDRDAQYPVTVDPLWTQQQELTAADGAAFDQFGTAVSVSGDTAVIGAWHSTTLQGAAYVFVRSGGQWSLQGKLTPDDYPPTSAEFGYSVSVCEDTAVIGAPNWNSHQGAAYSFVRNNGHWSQEWKFIAAIDGVVGDYFGTSVSVSGNPAVMTAVIGASGKNGGQGAAYVFARTASSLGSWNEQGTTLTASDGGAGDGFGRSVAVSGDTAVIGASGKNSRQGAAYVFVSSGVGRNFPWIQQGPTLTASDGAPGDLFGASVAVSGNTAVIGALDKNNNQGAAYVFVRSGVAWSPQKELTASDGAAYDGFGVSVSVSGNTAVIGASGKNNNQGAAYVFVGNCGVWNQQQELTASDGATGDRFGFSVSVSGDTAVIGAPYKTIVSNVEQGAAYVFGRASLASLGANTFLVGSAAGSSSVVLSYNGAWTAIANDSFLHISHGTASGTGSAVVVFTYDAFAGTGTRTGTVTIAGLTVTVTQAGTDYMGPGPVITLASGMISPAQVAVDGSGNVYIAAPNYSAIMEWRASTQQVTTLVSSGLYYPYGVAVDSSGNVYIADSSNNAIKEWSASTQQVTTLVPSGLNGPTGLAVDSSCNVYIADTGNNAVKEWSASTQLVTTLVGGLNNPGGAAVDGSGNVYISDSRNNEIEELPASTQLLTLLVSGLLLPDGVAVDGSGNVYIADTDHSAIKEWSPSTGLVTTLAQSGLRFPGGVAVDGAGNVYIADSANNAIKEIPYAFVGPSSLIEPPSAGTDRTLPVLPATTPLWGIFAPTSDQSWLGFGCVWHLGIVGVCFSFTANTSASPRTAHLTILGHQITVTQNGLSSPALSIVKAHTGNFVQGQVNALYTVTVSNAANVSATVGQVTVTENPPPGLTLMSMTGAGWTCPGTASNNCTRADVLDAGASYPPIIVKVNVDSNATSPQVNAVSASGGGAPNAYTTDSTTIANSGMPPAPLYDWAGNGSSGAALYDTPTGDEYTALSNGNGTYAYLPNIFTPGFDTLRSGDFNGDGKADLVVYNSHNALAYIGMGNGDGTFAFQSLFWSPGYDFVEHGDFNGDGKTDFALYNSSTGTMYTGISKGDGTFAYKYTLISKGYTSLRAADFTGDGKADIFLYNATNGIANLAIGDGTGGFTFTPLFISPGYNLVDVGDLNGDGKADLILYNATNGNAATGLGTGTGFRFTPLILSPGFTSVHLADYTGDGKADVTVYNKNTAAAYFGTGNGDGTFNFQSLFWSPGYDWVVPEDVNGDGKIDVVLYNSLDGTEYTGIGNGNGTFSYTYSYWGIGKALAR